MFFPLECNIRVWHRVQREEEREGKCASRSRRTDRHRRSPFLPLILLRKETQDQRRLLLSKKRSCSQVEDGLPAPVYGSLCRSCRRAKSICVTQRVVKAASRQRKGVFLSFSCSLREERVCLCLVCMCASGERDSFSGDEIGFLHSSLRFCGGVLARTLTTHSLPRHISLSLFPSFLSSLAFSCLHTFRSEVLMLDARVEREK